MVGTPEKAAAAAIIGADTVGVCPRPVPLTGITIRLDRPVLCVLCDVETGAVRLMRRVVDPSVGRGQ